MPNIKSNTSIINAGIHIGHNTHHQDHVITLHNFNTINTRVRLPINPIPPELLTITSLFIFIPKFICNIF